MNAPIPLIMAFALGVLVRDFAQDFRDARAALSVAPTTSATATPPRPRCPGTWIIKRADQGRWLGHCFKVNA